MRVFSLFISALAHAAIILVAGVSMPSFFKKTDEFQMIPIELLEIGTETNIKATAPKLAEEEQTKEVEKEEVRYADAPPPPPPMSEPIPDDAIPDPTKKPKKTEAKKDKSTKFAAKSTPRRKPKPPKKQSDLDLSELTALLDKEPKDKPKSKAVQKDDALDNLDFLADEEGETPRQSFGAGDGMTISEINALRQEMQKCWRPPTGAANPEELVVELKIFLSEDGSLARPPKILRSGTSSFGKNSFTAAAERAALAAVNKCAPYDFLPIDKYERWDEVTITFDPAAMVGY